MIVLPAPVNAGRYTVHPLGRDTPLFNRPQTKTDISQRTEIIHLPCPISIEAFTADLQEYTTNYAGTDPKQRPANSKFYGPDRSFQITKDGVTVSPMQLVSLLFKRLASSSAKPRGSGDRRRTRTD